MSPFEPIGVDKDGEAVSLVDVVEIGNKEILDTMVSKQDVRELYEAFESCLTETEEMVLGMRYGLYHGKEHTQREVAGKLDIFRSYASQIEKKAIEKIRIEFAKHGQKVPFKGYCKKIEELCIALRQLSLYTSHNKRDGQTA